MSLTNSLLSALSNAPALDYAVPSAIRSQMDLFLGTDGREQLWLAHLPSSRAIDVGQGGFFLSPDGRIFHQLQTSPDAWTSNSKPPSPLLATASNRVPLGLFVEKPDARIFANDPENRERLASIRMVRHPRLQLLEDAAFYVFPDARAPQPEGALLRWWSGLTSEVQEPLLLLEDDAMVARAVMMSLKYNGFSNIHHASKGEEAVRLLEQDPKLGVILSDYNLAEGKTGLQAVRSMRKIRPNLRVLFMSGNPTHLEYEMTDDERRSFEVLTKPTPPNKLNLILRSLLVET